jgi:hypothetical protein
MMNSHHPLRAASRREFLERAGFGCGSLALTALLHQEGLVAAESANPLVPRPAHFPAKAKAVIWLFQTGSPSQVDTFDYKPHLQQRDGQKLDDADPKTGFFTTSGNCLRSPFKFRQHGESGAWMSEIFPHLSEHADDMAFLYSCFSKSNNHTPAILEMNSGMIRQGFPSVGSWVTYGLGSENANLPGFVVMHKTKPRGGDPVWSSGFLPAAYQATALDPSKPAPIANLDRPQDLTDEQQRSLLDVLRDANLRHAKRRPFDSDIEARIESFELAYRMQAAAPEAFDVSRETKAVQEMYGLHRKESADYGRECLIARRLVERGVRFVQIFAQSTNVGNDVPWDAHQDIRENHSSCAASVDQPSAALLADLKARGMLDSTLVIWGGEFGRTSDSQGSKGRDHNPHALTVWMAGGGIRGGAQYGKSDEFGYKAVENRVNAHDIHATVLHLLGLDHEKLTYRFNGRDFRLTDVEGNVLKSILA